MNPSLSLLPLGFLGLEALSGVVAVVLGLGLLIFVHELGHFLAAKWAGVRVEVFSLGMGPRLWGFQRGDTDYRLSALPLGGYVRMLGQDDSEPVQSRSDSPDDFRNKPAHKRFIILIAGVCMNTVFAVIAFVIAFAVGIPFVAPEVGAVGPGSAASQMRVVSAAHKPAEPGLQPGDEIVSIDGTEILAWEDIQTAVALSGEKAQVEVDRPTPDGPTDRIVFEATLQRQGDDPYPRLGIEPCVVVGELDESSPLAPSRFAKGGMHLEKGDQIMEIAPVGSRFTGETSRERDVRVVLENPGKPVLIRARRRRYDDDGRPLAEPAKTFDVEVTPEARPIYSIGLEFADKPVVDDVLDGSPAKGVLQPGDAILSIDGKEAFSSTLPDSVKAAGDAHSQGTELSAPVPIVVERRVKDRIQRLDVPVQLKRKPNGDGWQILIKYTPDLVQSVEKDSPAAKAGIEPGDHVTKVSTDTFLGLWHKNYARGRGESIRAAEEGQLDRPWQIVFEKADGKLVKKEIAAVRSERAEGWLGLDRDREGRRDRGELAARSIMLRRGPVAACSLGVVRTIRMVEQLGQTIRALFARRVSTRELGGPIQIAGLVYTVSQSGLGKFFYILGILSVNLAVLNVLPIPVLDGGHIFLLGIEKLKGRPLSDDVLKYVQYAGLLFVLGLMAYVCFNDIRRGLE